MVAMSAAASAQLYLKPMVGATLANVTKLDKDYKFGLAAGAELEYFVAPSFSLTGGAIYSMQGCKKADTKLNTEYINIPVLANYYIAPGLALKAGVQLGIKTKGKYEYDGKELEAFSDAVKSTVFDIPVGISYEFNDFVIDARYNIGITNTFEINELGLKEEGKNSVFMLTVGYKFVL